MPDDPEAQLPVDQQLRRKLRAERLRTGISARVLLASRGDIPKGLLPSHVSRWADGMIKSAPASHVGYVLQLWASARDDAGRIDKQGQPIARPGRRHPKAGEEWIAITDDMRVALKSAMEENGLTVRQLVEMEDAPPELTPRMINAWLYGDSGTARQRLWEFVSGRFAVCIAKSID